MLNSQVKIADRMSKCYKKWEMKAMRTFISFHLSLLVLIVNISRFRGVIGLSPPLPSHVRTSRTCRYPFHSSSTSFLASSASPSASASASATEFVVVSYECMVEKPAGIILEERKENEASGVFCIIDESLDSSNGFLAGIRTGDILAKIDDKDVRSSTFEEVLEQFGNALSPVSVTVERTEKRAVKPKAVVQPKRMPSAKKLVKASTNANFWKDPLMIGSAIFTVALPLGIYLVSSGPK